MPCGMNCPARRRIEVVDDDLGEPHGYSDELVSTRLEVCLGHVGAVAERCALCNSREWQRLVEVCRVVDTY
jgi:hypothetical protein